MKLLIIDDEAHVRRALHLIIQKIGLSITELYEAADVERAMELIEKEDPEIIISDVVMPGMTGIQLIEQLKHSHPHTKTVIVSGHNDFQYVRSALRAGSIDYLLKPLGREQVASAVSNAVNAWNRDFEMRRQVIENTKEVRHLSGIYRKDLLSRLLYGPVPSDECEKLKSQTDLPTWGGKCGLLLFSFEHLKHLTGQIPLLTQATIEETIRKRLNSVLQKGAVFSNQKAFTECLVLLSDCPDLAETGKQLRDSLLENIGCLLPFGSAFCSSFPDRLADAYRQAQADLQSTHLADFLPGDNEARKTRAKLPLSGSIKLPASFSKDMYLSILSGKPEAIREHAGQWADLLSENGRVFSDIASLLKQYEAMKLAVLNDIRNDFSKGLKDHWKPADQLPFPFDSHGYFNPLLLGNLIGADLTDLSNQFQLGQGREASVVQSVVLYLKEHYQEDINQSALADRFFISRDYLSHKFKEETGMGMVHYLNLLRIEKAKQLLLLPDARVNDVAVQVGYRDEKYFCKVFKKYEGISPSQFRLGAR